MPVTREEAIAELQRRGVETPQTQMANTSAITPEEARTELARRGVIVPEAAAGPTRREQNQQTMAALSRLPTGTPEYGRYKPMEERQVGPYGQAIGESLAGGAVTPLSTATSMARGIGQLAAAAPAAAMQAWQELSKRPSPAVLRYIEQKTGKPVSLGKVTPPPPDWLNFVEDVRAGAFGTEPTEMEQWAEAVQQRPIIGQEKAGVSSLPTKAAYGGIDLGTRMLAMQAAGAKIIPGQAAKGAATVAGKIKAIEMNAGRIAAQVFITRPGTVAERIEAASKAFVFASSPSATGFVPTTPGAFLADVSANTVADLVLEGKYDPSDPNTWVRVGANIVTAGGTRPHKAPVSKGAKLATEAVRLAATEVPPEAPRAGAEAKAEVAEPPAREPFPKPTVKPVAPITPDEAAAELSRRGVEVPPGRARKPPAAIQAPEGARVPPPAPEVAVEAPGAAEQPKAMSGKPVQRTMLQGRAGERGATQLPPALGKIAQAVRPLGAEEPEISRAPKDAGLMTRFVNSPQFAFEGEKYGAKATKAVADLQLAEFKAIEDTGRDAKKYVEEAFRKVKGKEAAALYDVMEGKSLEDIAKTNPRPEVMAAAKSTREFFDNARDTVVTTLRGELGRMLGNMTKAEIRAFGKDVKFTPKMKKAEMVQAAQKALYPDDWGPENYLPHMFSGGYRVSAKGEFIGRARTEYAAKKLIADVAKSNPGLRVKDYKIEVDTYAPSDVTRLSSKNFFRLLGEFKKALEIPASDVQDATRGIIGRQTAKKKFWGRTMQRQGYTGYSKDIKEALRTYIYGFHRWQMLNNMTKEVQPAIEELRSTGRPLAADVLQQLYDYTWGKPSKLTLNVDASLRKIPGIREFVAPLWLDRNVSRITRTVAKLHLLTPRFGVLNRLQVYQTLYPIVGEEGIGRGHVLMHTKEGSELLTRHGVRQDIGQYGLSTWKGGWERIREKFTGEARNQQFAFLAVYDKARSAGFSDAKAASYAKLRGQLMTQFTPLRSDTPGLLQHPLGKLIFQYRRFPIKDTELLVRFVKERNVGGVARWLGSRVILGGLNYLAAPLAGGAAGFALHGWLKKIREEHGDIAADMIAYGLPGMVGIDMSGSLQSLEMPWGKNIYERLGRIAASPGVGTVYEVARGLLAQRKQPVSDTQKAVTALRKVPALKPLAELWALTSGNYDLRTDTGQLRLKRTIGDVLRSMGSFRTAKESNRQLAIEALAHIVTERDKAINAWTTDGDMAEVSKWNEVWPEFYILPDDLVARKMRRLQDYGKETIERTAAPKRIKGQFLTEE